jgi:hypothetical protein
MKNTALITIDIQQSFSQRPYWQEQDVPAFKAAMIDLINTASQVKMPIVRVHHIEDSGAFSLASGFVKPFDWLPSQHDLLIEKHVHNAFTDTGLDRWLRSKGITSDLGYEVDYITEATLTFPMQHKNGKVYSADEIKARTELVLEGRFAAVRTVNEMKSIMLAK